MPISDEFGASSITGLFSKNTSIFFSKPKASGLVLSTATLRIDPGM